MKRCKNGEIHFDSTLDLTKEINRRVQPLIDKEIEKAIKDFEQLKNINNEFQRQVFDEGAIKHINMAISALEKQLPKAPKLSYDNEFTDADGNSGMKVRHIECPSCECELEAESNYCPDCGQKIERGDKQ